MAVLTNVSIPLLGSHGESLSVRLKAALAPSPRVMTALKGEALIALAQLCVQ